MHVDDLKQIRRLADERIRLKEAKRDVLEMYAEGAQKAGFPVPMTLSSTYYAREHQKMVRIWLDEYTVNALVYVLDQKLGEVDSQLCDLGIDTNERGQSDEAAL